MIRRPPRSTLDRSSAASDVYKRQAGQGRAGLRGAARPAGRPRQPARSMEAGLFDRGDRERESLDAVSDAARGVPITPRACRVFAGGIAPSPRRSGPSPPTRPAQHRRLTMTKVMNVAMIGGGFMGKAHAMAYASMPMFFWPAPAIPHRKVVVDVTDGAAEEARRRFGLDEAPSDWAAGRARPDIHVVDIGPPHNVPAERALAPAQAGTRISYEKTRARPGGTAAPIGNPLCKSSTESIGQADGVLQVPILKGLGVGVGGKMTWYGVNERALAPFVTNGEVRRRTCLLYTSDAADERSSVDLGGRRILKKKHTTPHTRST